MNASDDMARRNKKEAELELRRLMKSGQPPMAPDKPEPPPPSAEEIEAYHRMQDKIDEELEKLLGTDSQSKESPQSEDDTTRGDGEER